MESNANDNRRIYAEDENVRTGMQRRQEAVAAAFKLRREVSLAEEKYRQLKEEAERAEQDSFQHMQLASIAEAKAVILFGEGIIAAEHHRVLLEQALASEELENRFPVQESYELNNKRRQLTGREYDCVICDDAPRTIVLCTAGMKPIVWRVIQILK